MLPPGIYLWESGDQSLVSPSTTESISLTSPLWKREIERCGPWNDIVTVDGVGDFLQSSIVTDLTIVVCGKCSTTMEAIRALEKNNILGEWGTLIAVEQSHGRGQLRRHWISPPGNLHASALLPATPKEGIWRGAMNDLLPLVCGYLLSDGLALAGAQTQIKWPNDLLQNNRKIGGILIEEQGGVDILGFGLNFVQSPPDALMRENHSVSAAVLQTEFGSLGVLELWETLVNHSKRVYDFVLGELTPSQFRSALTS